MSEAYAGVELGGTKCVAILARGSDGIIARKTVPTTTPDETLGRLADILSAWKSGEGFAALGIASFGPLDLDSGRIASTPKPGWRSAQVKHWLEQAAGVPAAFDTDVNGAALAEMRWGSGRGMADFAYITVGTGVGVGLIVNDKPTRGFAHCELGHIRVARLPGDTFPGSCPFHGDCVEGLAAGPVAQGACARWRCRIPGRRCRVGFGRVGPRAAVPCDRLRRSAASDRHRRRSHGEPAAPPRTH
ncbi:MAG: ROK family protein [Sphingomicrobium sp.]